MPHPPGRRLGPAVAAVLGLLSIIQGVSRLKAADEPAPVAPAETFTEEQTSHWAYQVPRRPAVPSGVKPSWARNPIDAFIQARHESVDFRHAPEADRVALIRRLTFDLTGLPPTADEVKRFQKDGRPDAYERLVDRLLDSPGYGERWAQHWLDLAHYADSNGFELDAERPDLWRYRDWVVSALNADLPYDEFVTLQLAGDEARPGDHAALIATGFGRCGPREVVGGNVDPVDKRQSELTEITSTVGSVFLGLTLGCARCHDHKFDALPTTDYYRLQSFFAASQLVDLPLAPEAERKAFEDLRKAIAARAAPLRKRQADLESPYRKTLLEARRAMLTPNERLVLATPADKRTPQQKRLAEGLATTLMVRWEDVAEAVAKIPADHAERERLKREIEAIDRDLPRPPAGAQALADMTPHAPETFVARRGDPKSRGPRVAPRPPGVVLTSQAADAFEPASVVPTEKATGRRLALAKWMTRADNPLTSRVVVNRLWQHHFGRGLVVTPSDYGVRGEPPTHPELLDWLATELIAGGWRLKPLHRLMVTSATYRQASRVDPAVEKAQIADDPENSLLWRMNRRRMEAESLRDAMLSASGELNPKAGGPGVLVPIEKEVEDLIFTEAEVVDLWPETLDTSEHSRRSLYLFRKRNLRYPMFDAFDVPDGQSACPERGVSTHALQALVMLNSDFAAARARAFAGRALKESGGDPDAALTHAYLGSIARPPTDTELAQGRRFLASQAALLAGLAAEGQPLAVPTFVPTGKSAAEAAAWVDFALAMLNRNEFLYVP